MKIFIIEDEPAIREELVQLLQKYGYQCDSSDDFHHIVQAALSSGANLILLDINLPYQDGFQVCREIRQKSNLPIIVLTSRNSDFDEFFFELNAVLFYSRKIPVCFGFPMQPEAARQTHPHFQ